MTKDDGPVTLSVYIPKAKMDLALVERLEKLGREKDRSINYLIVEAIRQYLDNQEAG